MQDFHVGLPCLKLSLHPSSQIHKGKRARTCSVGCTWDEMCDKRKGRDKSIDHSLTGNNVWLCGSTDMDMEQVIQTEIDRINAVRTEQGKRKMRSDAISAIEMIQKPPMAVMEGLTREEQVKLLKDSDEVVESILHDWAPGWKTMATVIHFDEMGGKSPHPHKIFMPITEDKDGCPVLNAKRDFNLKFFTYMNKEYPQRMREWGYPILDCEIYEDMSEEERKQHREKKKDYGLEGFEYKQKKTAEQEAQIKANEDLIDGQKEVISTQKDLIAVNDDMIADQDRKISQAEKALTDIQENVKKERETLKSIKSKADSEEAKIKKQKEQSKELNIKILSKEQVKALPEPDLTFDKKFYKVSKQDYKRLLATAGQVDVVKQEYAKKEAALEARSKELDKRETDIEKSRMLPWKEKQELAVLHKFRASVEWIVNQLPDTSRIKRLLQRALSGEDLTKLPGLEAATGRCIGCSESPRMNFQAFPEREQKKVVQIAR